MMTLRQVAAWMLAGAVALLTIAPAHGVTAQVPQAEPVHPAYRALEGALARYRTIASGPDIRPPVPATVLREGAAYAGAGALRRFLTVLGDLPATAPAPLPGTDTVYAGDLVAGIVAFQRRHGLEPDGVIGPATRAQLRVPTSRRVQQIELAMDRWRQLPGPVPERGIVVNIPAFRLYAFERGAATSAPLLRMNVIVGQAHRHHTPVFTGTMREVVFQPYWDVPLSIARNELLPAIRRDRGYLEREHLEIVRGGDEGAARYSATAANLERVADGTLRLRQRPGPWNALGAVKFVFPNRYNVYLHGTPAQQLFASARRDFSHGCIRLEAPAALAAWVLDGQAGWTPTTIAAAMTTGPRSRHVRIERPIVVHVLYSTAIVGDDGTVYFYPDIYGHDAEVIGPARPLAAAPAGSIPCAAE